MPRTDNNQNPSYGRIQLEPASNVERQFLDTSRQPETAPGLQVQEQKQMWGRDAPNAFADMTAGPATQFMQFLRTGVDIYKAGGDWAKAFIKLKAAGDKALELEADKQTIDWTNDDTIDDVTRMKNIQETWASAADRAYTTSAINRFNGIAAGEKAKLRKVDDDEEWFDIMSDASQAMMSLGPQGSREWLSGASQRLRPNNQRRMGNFIKQQEVATVQQQFATQNDVVKTAVEATLSSMSPQEQSEADPEIVTAQILQELTENNDFPADFFNPDSDSGGFGAYLVNTLVSGSLSKARVTYTASKRQMESDLAISNYVTRSQDPSAFVALLEDPTRTAFTSIMNSFPSLAQQGEGGQRFLDQIYANITTSGKQMTLMSRVLSTMPPLFYETLNEEEKQVFDTFLKGVEEGDPEAYAEVIGQVEGLTKRALDFMGQLHMNTLDREGKKAFLGKQEGAGKGLMPPVGDDRTSSQVKRRRAQAALSDTDSLYHSEIIQSYSNSIASLSEDQMSGPYRRSDKEALMQDFEQITSAMSAKEKGDLIPAFFDRLEKAGIPVITPEELSDSVQAGINSINGFVEGVFVGDPTKTGAAYQLSASALAVADRIPSSIPLAGRGGFFDQLASSVSLQIETMSGGNAGIQDLMGLAGLKKFDPETQSSEDYYINSLALMDTFLGTFPTEKNRAGLGIDHQAYHHMVSVVRTNLEEQGQRVARASGGMFTWDDKTRKLSLTPNNPEALSYLFQAANDIASSSNTSSPWTPETKSYFTNYMAHLDQRLQSLNDDPNAPFILDAETARTSGISKLAEPLLKVLQNYGQPENGEFSFGALNESLRTNPELLELVAGLGTHFIQDSTLRGKYVDKIKENDPRFRNIVSSAIVGFLSPSPESVISSGRFNEAVESFYRPVTLETTRMGLSSTGGITNQTTGILSAAMGLSNQRPLTLATGVWDESVNFFQYGYTSEDSAGTAAYSPDSPNAGNPNASPALFIAESALGMPIDIENEADAPSINKEANLFVMNLTNSLVDALSTDPYTREAISDNRYSRLGMRLQTAVAEASGIATNTNDAMLSHLLTNLPAGTRVTGRVVMDSGLISEKSSYDLLRSINGSSSDRARIQWTIESGVAPENSDRSPTIQFLPNTPMVQEREAAVKRVMGNRFPNVPLDQVERLVDREQTIVPKVFGDFTSRTLLNELENSGINLDYRPTEDSPSLNELVDTTINDTLVTVRDRVDRPMTSISSVSDGANILTGLNGLTADNMTVFSLLVEQRLGAENVSSEAIYDFVRELQKEATQPSNQERLVSPLGVLVYHDDRRNMSIQLAQNIADKDYGRSFVQPTSERLAAYRRNERQRGFMRRHAETIAPYHFGEVDRDWVSVHGYPQPTTTINNYKYREMMEEYTNPATPFVDLQGGYGAD